MSVKEGLRRVNKLGRVLGTTGACLMLLTVVVGLLAWRLPNATAGVSFALAELFVPGVGLLLAGIVILTVSWIGEGFAEKDDSA